MGYSKSVQRSSRSYGEKKVPAPLGGREAPMNAEPKSTRIKGYPEYAGFTENTLDGGGADDGAYDGYAAPLLKEGGIGGIGLGKGQKRQVPQFTDEVPEGRESFGSESNGQDGRGSKLYANFKSKGAVGRP